MIPLRFLQSWNGYDRGAEVQLPHPGLAEDLVRMKVAELNTPAPVSSTPAAGSGSAPVQPTPAADAAPKRARK